MKIDKACPCCGTTSLNFIGTKNSNLENDIPTGYRYWYCRECFYRFQGNPNTKLHELYDEKYYLGKGADQLVDYEFELKYPELTVRRFEFEGILNVVKSLITFSTGQERIEPLFWLDFGCGNGAFVNYLNSFHPGTAVGFDIGFAANEGKRSGVKILQLEELKNNSFEVITAIEVLEHTANPREMIDLIYKLLKPGGLFFYTTGNSAPYASNFLKWRYTAPTDVHIGFFEPKTISKLLLEAGFSLVPNENYAGWGGIYKYKILKNLKIKKRGRLHLIPVFNLFTRMLDKKFQLMALPAAKKPNE